MSKSKETKSGHASKSKAKKSYANPKVKKYGNIHEITLGTGRHGGTDSPQGPRPAKTQP
jgi:hypothetical protein